MIRISGLILAVGLWSGTAWARPLTPAEVAGLQDFPGADVVILGEIHDNAEHHANQARLVAKIRPRALVFEMLTADQAAAVPADRADADRLAAALKWADSGWPDFGLYHPIFAAAPDARIYGADVSRGQLRAAVTEGAAQVFGDEAARYGLTRGLLADDQADREAEQARAHCNMLSADLLAGMVQAQRLRDAALARAAVRAMQETGGPVVVITGTGHARKDQGVPAALALAAPQLTVFSLGQLEADPGPLAPYDAWVVTPPMAREDPCRAFAG